MKALSTAISSLKPKSLGTYTYQGSSLGSDIDFPYPSGWGINTKGHWDKVFDSLGSDLKGAKSSQNLSVTQEALRKMFTTLSKGLAKSLPDPAPNGVKVLKDEATEVSYQGPEVTLSPSFDGVYVKFKIPCPPTDGKKAKTEYRDIRILMTDTCVSLPQ